MMPLLTTRISVGILGALMFALAVPFAAAQTNPVPLINQPLVPSAVAPGGPGFNLTVNGTGFVQGSTVYWDGSPRVTTFVKSSQLTAAILNADIPSARTATVTVSNPSPGGGTSTAAWLQVAGPLVTIIMGPDSEVDDCGKSTGGAAVADGVLYFGYIIYQTWEVGLCTVGTNFGSRTASEPFSMTAGNFRGGNIVAATNGSANTVSLLLSQSELYSTGTNPESVAVGDFNSDGNLDLAVTAGIGVSILLGNSDGTFQPHVDYAAGGSGGIAVGDFNGDGKLDLAVAGGLSILLGNGDGTFQAPVNYPAASGNQVVAADINGDGKLDLAVVGSTLVFVLLGNGDGTFQDPVAYAPGGSQILAADFNADGRLDLAVQGALSAGPSILLGNGDGTFQSHLDFTNRGSVLVAFDSNNDGLLDFVEPGVYQTWGQMYDSNVEITVQMIQALPSLSSSSLAFGSQSLDTMSSPQIVTLTNAGNASMPIYSISISGTNPIDFAETNNCGTTLGPGANCMMTVTFMPIATGARAAEIDFSTGYTVGPVTLTGTGIAPAVTLSSTSLAFGNQIVGTTSSAQTITLTNSGPGLLAISSIAATGNYGQTNTCGTSVPAGATCTISVTFTPATLGPQGGSVAIADNAPGSPQTISLSGTGISAASVQPTSLSFGNEAVGSTSASQAVTVTNLGAISLSITSIGITGMNPADFAQSNTCGSSLAAGATCTINVTFTPTVQNVRTATVTITDTANPPTQMVSLSGTGIGTPQASLIPASLDFGNQKVGTTSAAQASQLSNPGTGTLTIGSIVASGDFAQTNTCGNTLLPGAGCIITVTFTPTVEGARNGSITVTDNANPATQTVSLTGVGLAPLVTLSHTSLAFGNQKVGTKSAPRAVTLTNTGNATLAIKSISFAGLEFSQKNTCSTNIPPGQNCKINVVFAPTTKGSAHASLVVKDNASPGKQQVALTGNGL